MNRGGRANSSSKTPLGAYPRRDYFPDGPLPVDLPVRAVETPPRTEPSPRLLVRAGSDRAVPIDVTHAVVSAVAYELWKVRGGDPGENWTEAERQVLGWSRTIPRARPSPPSRR
ncbi:MAG: DUF2934 domain-containing protein [Phycisphaeraceae bacterium]|nr:DUF2934 domain-containing protein [Phycisphaeraceae bacterium]